MAILLVSQAQHAFPALLPQPCAELSRWAPLVSISRPLLPGGPEPPAPSGVPGSELRNSLASFSCLHLPYQICHLVHPFFSSRVFFFRSFLLPPLRPRCSLWDYNNPYPPTVSTVVGKADLESVLMKLTVQCVHPCI